MDRLRGCIGTTEPQRTTLEEEIIANAISAATQDPRFYPVEKQELENLDISVDVLGAAEEVDGPEDLDPKKYGLVVRTIDGRRALLLPDLEGVDTVDQQIRITCRKGGIDPVADRTGCSGSRWSAITSTCRRRQVHHDAARCANIGRWS